MQDDTSTPPETQDHGPFDRVPEALRPALEARGFRELTAVQEAALDALEEHRDLQITSQTGSGKTVALGIVMAPDLIAAIADPTFNPRQRPGPDALVIAPTRELAAQVEAELKWLYGPVRGLSLLCVTGGTNVGRDLQRLQNAPRLVVGTPGRILDHIRSGALDTTRIRHLVLDEADQMLDLGFRDELEAILETLPSDPAERRTHLISATFPDAVRGLTERYQSDPLHVEGTRLGEANADIQHVAHLVSARDRYAALVNLMLLTGEQRSLVFVPTRNDAAMVAEKLANDGFAALPLSGDLAQAQRTRTLNAFRSGTVRTIVATDVAARGIDVKDIGTVIHYGLPQDAEVYTHRSGRTGRAGSKGRSILLAPVQGARRARRMLKEANVEAEWTAIPSAAAVEKQVRKRARRTLNRAVESKQPTESELEFARRLLEGRDPETVVAALVAAHQPELPCKPRDVANPPPPKDGPRERTGRDAPWERREKRPMRRRDTGAEYATFSINWGLRSGANPRRLLAMVCRRGNLRSDMIGAIELDQHSATFQVDKSIADEFEKLARQPDTRDPRLKITRDR